jgi:ribonuclease Z
VCSSDLTNGFLFKQKLGPRKLRKEEIQKHPLDPYTFQQLKDGKDVATRDGVMLKNKDLTLDPNPPKSYAYCSDTAYSPDIVALIKEVDLLYHESTFLESESELAFKTKHATAAEAAKIASMAKVKRLLLGHYSTRYDSLSLVKEEAEKHFKEVLLADDGLSFSF